MGQFWAGIAVAGFLAATAAGVEPAKAQPPHFSENLTLENFGTRLETTMRLTFPNLEQSVILYECIDTESGDLLNQCTFEIAGTPIEVRSEAEAKGPADYINIFSVDDDAQMIANLVDLTYLTALTLGVTDRQGLLLHDRLRLAAIREQPFTLEAPNFQYAFKLDGGAYISVFKAR